MSSFRFLLSVIFFLFSTPVLADTFTLQSSSIPSAEIDKLYTCDGKNISPALEWKNAPAQTVSYAIILSDPDAPSGTFYHWILFNIPKSVSSLPENITSLPNGTVVGINTAGQAQYKGPCPPQGSKHQYIFNLYALDTNLNLPNGADAKIVLDAIKTHVSGTAELKFTFGH